MRLPRYCLIAFLLATPAFSQLTTKSPVDEFKDQVTQALQDANAPFTPDQEKELALLIEEERQASENLFGVIWDFSKGPPEGEQRDQALAGIQWMLDEFKKKLPTYLTTEQRAAWEKYESSLVPAAVSTEAPRATQPSRIQQIRVTNNAFNVETADANGNRGLSEGGAKTEVIENGGVGDFHGNFSATFQNQRLNARNPFASNKPPYYERTIYGNVSGPVIRDRLTLSLLVNDNRAENVSTVKALTPDGPFSLGITKPVVKRSYNLKGVLQISSAHSLNTDFLYSTSDSRNENVGDFALPERASHTFTDNYTLNVREIAVLNERTVHDIKFSWINAYSQRNPFSTATAIIVKDAFTSGGSQNKNLTTGNTYQLSNLIYYAGEKLTMRSGFQGVYRRDRSVSEDNFYGEFTFSDLASYVAGKPLKYRITCCDPVFNLGQTKLAFFSQNDLKLTRTFTLLLGLRYQYQTDLDDTNNIDPRVSFAYAIGNSTVIRGGAGIFHGDMDFNQAVNARRVDGRRLYEIQIDNPGWPNPYAAGSVRPRSRRAVDYPMKAESYYPVQIGIERSLPRNLFVTLNYQRIRGIRLTRSRDINAPFPGSNIRPNPDEGQIALSEHNGQSTHHHIKASMRQRFSIFNVTANYEYYTGWNDSAPVGGFNGLPTNSHDRLADWGYAGGEHHEFNTSVNSRMPLDVYLTTKIAFKSGSSYTITTGKDDNQDGVINDRPAGVPKNNVWGPHYFDVSFNFSKAVQLGRGPGPAGDRNAPAPQGPQMNVFANLNNAFNMTHPGTPSGVMTSPFFMKSFNATNPRTIEVGTRFQF
jgi:hypothetical protein